MVFLWGNSLTAQIILEPQVTGNVAMNRTVVKSYWHFYGSSTVWHIGGWERSQKEVHVPLNQFHLVEAPAFSYRANQG